MDARQLEAEVAESWAPPPSMTGSQWADAYAVLSSESSADLGRWKTLPYQREILDAMSDPLVEWVTWMKSARVGYTKCINWFLGRHAHQDPCSTMVVQPTEGDAEGYSKDEVAPMIRDVEELRPLFPESNRRESNQTILHKIFPGGQWRFTGADSPRGFRRVSMRNMVFDETDGYKQVAGEEGDQIKLGVKRTEYYWNRKIIMGSTPTLKKTSRIAKAFARGTREYYRVPCPHCETPQVLGFENLKWPKGRPQDAGFQCIGCNRIIEYRWHRWMIEEADRRFLAGDRRYGWVATNPEPEVFPSGRVHRSFHCWTALSYAPNATWAHIAAEWMASHKNVEERKTFINTCLGLPYDGEGEAPAWRPLYDRRLAYTVGTVPVGGLILFAGVDVQKDRLEVEIVAYGRGMRSWSVDYRVLPGDTSALTGERSPWPALSRLLDEEFEHESGARLRLRMMGVDSGYNTSVVYQWVSGHDPWRVIATDGRDTYSQIIGTPKQVEVTKAGKKRARSVKLWPIGVSLAKSELYGWLRQQRPTDESGEDLPHGWCEWPQYAEEYFRGLTAEEIVPRIVKGFRRYQWEKVYERNEPLDCRVIARACAALVGCDRWDRDGGEAWEEYEEAVAGPRPSAEPEPVVTYRPNISRASDPYLP